MSLNDIRINASEMMEAFARLKKIPLSKVIRNASRDFVREAYRMTPVAKISKSEYYRAVDPKDPKHRWYIHETMLKGRSDLTTKSGNMKSVSSINKAGRVRLNKVRVRKGFSKATWAGAFAVLGLPAVKEGVKYPVGSNSGVIQRDLPTGPEATITDEVRFDAWGRSTSDKQHETIVRAGFANAAAHMAGEYNKMVREAWNK